MRYANVANVPVLVTIEACHKGYRLYSTRGWTESQELLPRPRIHVEVERTMEAI